MTAYEAAPPIAAGEEGPRGKRSTSGATRTESVQDFHDPTEPVPLSWVREPVSYFGPRSQQEEAYRTFSAWRRYWNAQRHGSRREAAASGPSGTS